MIGRARRWTGVFGAVLAAGLLSALSVPAGACAAGTVGWQVHVVSEPSSFNAQDAVSCEGEEEKCDSYQLLIQNAGNEPSSGPITVTDRVPEGLTVKRLEPENQSGLFNQKVGSWGCEIPSGEGGRVMKCRAPERALGEVESVAAGRYAPFITVVVSAPTPEMSGVLRNEVTVEGGGAPAATSVVQDTPIGKPLVFEPGEFAFEPLVAGGAPAVAAAGHPWEITTDVGVTAGFSRPHGGQSTAGNFAPSRNMRSISVELPAGFTGDPLATTERCEEILLRTHACSLGSEIGVYGIRNASASKYAPFQFTEDESSLDNETPVYNMIPEAGYPAEFGLAFANTIPLLLYADVVHTGSGYRVRVVSPGIPTTEETLGATITLFGDPGREFEDGSEAAFLDSPSDCTAEAEGLSADADGTARVFSSRLELESWGELGRVVSNESAVYPSVSGCAALNSWFRPVVGLAPSPSGSVAGVEEGSAGGDVPSSYGFALKVPQTTGFDEPATPDVRDVTVPLPEGVTADPSSATGLVGCPATGPEGINLGSDDIGLHGQDLGDPEATELGEGHEGGNNSPYDDGFYHAAAGHCPPGSVLGSVEVCTPLLANRANSAGIVEVGVKACEEHPGIAPLQGKLFLATPKCGGEGQPACKESSNPSEDSAENGELFSGYIEVSGDGVIVKVPGEISADPATDQLTGRFKENPQFPFSELRLHTTGGARAALANPQLCKSYAASSTVTSWAGQEVTAPSQPFTITGCGSSMPFGPSLQAATGSNVPGGNTPFALSFSRQDGEQDLSGLSETMPAGLVGKIAGIPLCPEAAANAGTCDTVSPESLIGMTSALVGPGPEPYSVTGGHVYLTGPYSGPNGSGPFGLSIVVPAKAGPFNFGNEVIRAVVQINPSTAQVTVTTNPLPQSKDGVQLRLRAVSTEVNRGGFLRNPTNCDAQSVTATITAAQGAHANVSAPLAPTGCQGLPFAPTFTETTKGTTSKADGASLTVTTAQKPGEADIQKVDVQLPVSLPSRLTTLQKACTEAQFNTNPAGCPEGSDVGTATAHTPLLNVPLTGPAYLVSHGGAAFPDVEFVLQGEGVTIILDGKTDIKKGITYSNFETVPDAPVESFTASFPEGPHSVLSAYGSLCNPTETITIDKHETKRIKGHLRHITVPTKETITKPLQSPTTIIGQNGTTIKQTTPITVTNCPKPKTTPAKTPTKKTKAKRKAGKK